MVHEDKDEVDSNLNFLRAVEKNAFSLVLSEDRINLTIKEEDDYLNEIKPLVEKTEKYGTGLFVTDQLVDDIDILQANSDNIEDIIGKFDFIIVNLNKSLIHKKANEKVKIILEIFTKLRTGGIIFIPKNTYQFMSGGRRGMEALIKVLDYKIELPPYTIKDVIIASKTK